MANETDTGATGFERHAQTVIGVLIIPLIGWAGYTLNGLSISVAQLTERVTALQVNMAAMQSLTGDRYTRQDAIRDLTAVQKILDDHTQRIRDLENKAR